MKARHPRAAGRATSLCFYVRDTFSFILCHFYSFSAISNISVKLKTLRCFFLSGFSKLEEILKRSQISLEMSNKFLKPNIL